MSHAHPLVPDGARPVIGTLYVQNGESRFREQLEWRRGYDHSVAALDRDLARIQVNHEGILKRFDKIELYVERIWEPLAKLQGGRR